MWASFTGWRMQERAPSGKSQTDDNAVRRARQHLAEFSERLAACPPPLRRVSCSFMGTHAGGRPAAARTAQVRAALDALRRVVQGLRMFSTRAEQATGLSGAQLFVLQQLAEAPARSLNELAVRTRTHQSSVSTVVTRLVERGLVSRKRSGEDARRVLLEVTPAGRALVTRAPETAQKRLITALEGLPAARRRSLMRDLETLVAALGMDHEPAALFFEPSEQSGGPHGQHRRR